jgi:hypothetical protein
MHDRTLDMQRCASIYALCLTAIRFFFMCDYYMMRSSFCISQGWSARYLVACLRLTSR